MILGGAQENTLYTVEGLRERPGYQVALVTGPAEGPEGSLLDRARRLGIDVRIVPELGRELSAVRDTAAYLKLRRVLKSLSPDIVHTHSAKAGVLGRIAAHRLKVPCVIHTCHGLSFHRYERPSRNWLYVRVERSCARFTHRIVSVCDAMTRQALAAGVGRPDQYVTIYSGMEVETFLEDRSARRAALRREIGLADSDIAIVKIARLFPLKGHEYVLRSAPEVLRQVPEARWVFVGDGVLRAELEALARSLGVAERVIFLGLVPPERIPEVLAAGDLLVHASLREGLARALPQALLSGLPAIGFDLDGAPEVILPDRTGLLAIPEDVAGLAAAQVLLCRDPGLRARMGAAGRETCRDRFDWRKMVDAIEKVYRDAGSGA